MNELDLLIETALRSRATDLHICENAAPRVRIDGAICEMKAVPAYATPETLARQIFSRLPPKVSEKLEGIFAKGGDIDCAITGVMGIRARANIYRSQSGQQIALRLLPSQIFSAEQIGVPFVAMELCKSKSGIFIVAGANGTGKTTTLASMIEIINNSKRSHVLTIENPVEYIFKSKMSLISQREVGLHAPDFYTALRSSLRENPDVVMLGEMRDLETARTALELAETGILVLATLHTKTAPSTIDRLVGQFPSNEQPQIRYMLAESLLGVLSQTLVEKKNGGLVAAFEFLKSTDAVKNIIREQKNHQLIDVIQTSRNLGMCTMEDSLLSLVQKGIIDSNEALAKAYRPAEMKKYLGQ